MVSKEPLSGLLKDLLIKHPLLNPIDELIMNYENLENDFKCFYPHAIEYANILKIIL